MRNMKISKRNVIIWIGIATISLLILMVGPLNSFYHGYYCEHIRYSTLDDDIAIIDIAEESLEQSFIPRKKNMVGVEIRLVNISKESRGTFKVAICDAQNGKIIREEIIGLYPELNDTWYKIGLDKPLKQGNTYKIQITNIDCENAPFFVVGEDDYLIEENIEGNLLVGYGYKEPTLKFEERVILVTILLAIGLAIFGQLVENIRCKQMIGKLAVLILLTSVLSWNYMFNFMDNKNTSLYQGFQGDSEALVMGVIEAEHENIPLFSHGLAEYNGIFVNVQEGWEDGYSIEDAKISIKKNTYTEKIVGQIQEIKFDNGEKIDVNQITEEGNYYIIHLQKEGPFNTNKYREIEDADFILANGEIAEKGELIEYISQFGLQGKVFGRLSRNMNFDAVEVNWHLVCSILTALVFVLIVLVLYFKYNFLFAAVFYVTFLLSPWIVNFARNLYWLEFTWFIPMLVGLVCSWKVTDKIVRSICYLLMFFSVLIKCLCGYEYITTIMLAGIQFLIVDFCKAYFDKDEQKMKLLFKTIFILGIMALAGFFGAILLHANIRGDGSIINGVKNIYERDVLRRTLGGDPEKFPAVMFENWFLVEEYSNSLYASIWEVIHRYFSFPTEIITGIAGNLFPTLVLIPIVIFVYNFCKKSEKIELPSMYICFFITSISWYVLGKSHSYEHAHINFVMWYFGFIQICLYTICRQIWEKKEK